MAPSCHMSDSQPSAFTRACRKVTDNDGFDAVIFALLVVNAMALVAEVIGIDADYGEAIGWLYSASTFVFAVEIALRIFAHGPRYGSFFRDGWNLFDFIVTAIALIPMVGSWSYVGRLARLARVVRIARLVSTWKRIVEPRQ